MGASQERAAFFNATLLVVTRHPGGPPGRPKIQPVLPLRAFLYRMKNYLDFFRSIFTVMLVLGYGFGHFALGGNLRPDYGLLVPSANTYGLGVLATYAHAALSKW
jgi:hypothetical protein